MKSERRQDLRQRIQTLPGLSPEDRAALLGLLAEKKRYGLVWEDKPEAAHELLREKIPVFVEDAKRRIEASEEDAPHHVLIEGDNLHALAALQYTHAGKIDVIYIDPPYNTGNKDFRYNDDYVDKEDAYRHSKWLSFMEKRLRSAKTLLTNIGVIFLSVDDNEVASLRILADGIFGDDNFVACVVWQKVYSPKNSARHFSEDHDYILVYAKNAEFWRPNLLPRSEEQKGAYKNLDNDPRGLWKTSDLSARNYYGEGTYPVVTPMGRVIAGPPKGRYWTVSKANFERLNSEGRIWWGRNKDSIPQVKRFLSDVKQGVIPQTLWSYHEVGHTQEAKKELVSICDFKDSNAVFDTPKPVRLIERAIRISGNKNSTILDFFAGSGTTLHATMALNAEDGGKRQCILVTNNENGICEEVCYERNKRVIQGYRTPKGEDVSGLTANHLHYLKTELVDREPTTKNRRQLVKLAVDLIRLKENAWDRIAGLSTGKEVQAFQGKDFTLYVVLEVDRIPAVVEQVRSLPGKSKVYILSPDADPFTADFEEVQDRVDLVALPEAIYRSLLPVWRTLPEPGAEAEVGDA